MNFQIIQAQKISLISLLIFIITLQVKDSIENGPFQRWNSQNLIIWIIMTHKVFYNLSMQENHWWLINQLIYNYAYGNQIFL